MFRAILRSASLAVALLSLANGAATAEEWAVSKSSGQVWIANAKAQPVALDNQAKLTPGDLIQTGPSGRALLTRGTERILLGPNSVISLPAQAPENGLTKILQRAGVIAIEAEKKDRLHFEVETPYLAAVVKGTSFTVSVGSSSAEVHVATGKVEVSDLKTGKIVLVLPNQSAHTSAAGFVVRGAGQHEPMRQGQPRTTGLSPVVVPRHGLRTPPRGIGQFARIDVLKPRGIGIGNDTVRIARPIGPARLDVSTATLGLARGDTTTPASGKSANSTIWSDTSSPGSSAGSSSSNSSSNGASGNNASGTGGAGTSSGSGLALGVGNAAAASNAGNGSGNAYGLINGGNGASVNGSASANGILHSKKK